MSCLLNEAAAICMLPLHVKALLPCSKTTLQVAMSLLRCMIHSAHCMHDSEFWIHDDKFEA